MVLVTWFPHDIELINSLETEDVLEDMAEAEADKYAQPTWSHYDGVDYDANYDPVTVN